MDAAVVVGVVGVAGKLDHLGSYLVITIQLFAHLFDLGSMKQPLDHFALLAVYASYHTFLVIAAFVSSSPSLAIDECKLPFVPL